MRHRPLNRIAVPLLAALMLLLQRPAGGATNDVTASVKSSAPQVTQLANGGFSLDFEIWQPAGHGKAKGLSVTYTWGGDTRTVHASRQDDRWRTEFSSQPQAHEFVNLLLRYSFELSEADKATIGDAEAKVVDAILRAIDSASDIDIAAKKGMEDANAKVIAEKALAEREHRAATERVARATTALLLAKQGANTESIAEAAGEEATAKLVERSSAARLAAANKVFERPRVFERRFASNFAAASKAIADSEAARALRQYGSRDQDGVALLLDHMGISEGQDGWVIAPGETDELAMTASAWVETDAAAYTTDIQEQAKALAALAGEKRCVLPAGVDPVELTDVQASTLLKDCLLVLGERPEANSEPLSGTLKAVATEAGENRAYHVEQLLKSGVGQSYAALAVRLAERTLLRSTVRTVERRKLLTALVDGLDTAFEEGGRKEDGATLVRGAARPRRYDIATGVVYVPHLEDVIVPSLIAVCAFEGCLDTSEVAWSARNGWWRAVSLDAGVRMKTIDKQDLRQSATIAFLAGLSFNPVSVFRLSAGMYGFENAQKVNNGSQPWQFVPYVGATLNVLNAATILGAIGLNNELGPTATPVE